MTQCVKNAVSGKKENIIMSKLIWQLYNDNMISEEVANLLLDKHYNRLDNKRYK